MARLVGVVGKSGSGKSRSIKNLNPETTFLIQAIPKDLPFRGWRKKYKKPVKEKNGKTKVRNYLQTRNPSTIVKAIKSVSSNKPEINTIVIDDFQYVMSFTYMDRIHETGWGKFNDIGDAVYQIMMAGQMAREDLTIFILTHSDEDKQQIKTVGKMVDQYITVEGLFTVVLWTKVQQDLDDDGNLKNQYYFMTQTDGDTTAKSPEEMFDFLIPNDLYYVQTEMEKYYAGE